MKKPCDYCLFRTYCSVNKSLCPDDSLVYYPYFININDNKLIIKFIDKLSEKIANSLKK